MRIFRDQSLSQHHTMVVQAITFIFKSLGLKCVQFLPQVMPTFLNVIRVCDGAIREVSVQGTVSSFPYLHPEGRIHYWKENATGFGHCCAMCCCHACCRSEVQLCFFSLVSIWCNIQWKQIFCFLLRQLLLCIIPRRPVFDSVFIIKLVLFRRTACAASQAFSDPCLHVLLQTELLNNRGRHFKTERCTLALPRERKSNLPQSANVQSSVGGDSTAALPLPSH